MIQVDKEGLLSLLNEYGYNFSKKELGLLRYVHSLELDESLYDIWDRRIEIAQFVKFLRLCGDNNYKITSTIQHPQQGKRKNTPESIIINSSYITTSISFMAEEMLHLISEGEYENVFKWDEKPTTEAPSYWFSGFSDLREPYSDEELNQIIEYEKGRAVKKPKGNAAKGMRLYFVYNKLLEAGQFGKSKLKEYSFLFDWYVLAGVVNDIGKGHSGTIGKEKYQQIRNWIEAYEKFKNSLKL